MKLTRRDTIKSILTAAAVSAVPAVAKAAIEAEPMSKAERIYASIKELISKCEAERGLPFDPKWDYIHIWLPASFNRYDIDATAKCFQREFPTFRKFCFKVFTAINVLDVNIYRIANSDYSDGDESFEIDPTYCSHAVMFLDDGQIVSDKF